MADTAAGQSGTWRTLAEAAVVLGLSERTIRRRIGHGRYATRHEDGRLLVCLPSGAGALADTLADTPAIGGQMADVTPDTPAPDGHPAGELAQLLREERERSSAAEQAAAMWQERARNLEVELQRALALPEHKEEPSRRRWWPWRRKE